MPQLLFYDLLLLILGFALLSFFHYCRILGTNVWWKPSIVGAILLGLYAWHIHYLAFVKFDYGYNMMFNVCMGKSFFFKCF